MKDTSGTCFEKSSGPLVSAKNIKLQIASFFWYITDFKTLCLCNDWIFTLLSEADTGMIWGKYTDFAETLFGQPNSRKADKKN